MKAHFDLFLSCLKRNKKCNTGINILYMLDYWANLVDDLLLKISMFGLKGLESVPSNTKS